jgi:hypothetical protein
MRTAPTAGIVLAGLLTTLPLGAQEAVSPVRRPTPTAFPASVAPTAGIGFGAARATAFDPETCPSDVRCVSLGSGSGWNVGVEVQVPLGRALGFEVAGQLARPSQQRCFRSQCDSPGHLWAVRGSAMLLWRFKPRAPIFFGLGAALTRFDPAPVSGQAQDTTIEYGAGTVVGYDFAFTPQLGGRVTWRGYLLAPSSADLPGTAAAKSVAWDNAFAFGVRIQLGS